MMTRHQIEKALEKARQQHQQRSSDCETAEYNSTAYHSAHVEAMIAMGEIFAYAHVLGVPAFPESTAATPGAGAEDLFTRGQEILRRAHKSDEPSEPAPQAPGRATETDQ